MSRRVRRFLKALVSVAFLVFLAAACSSDGFPTSYSDQAEDGVSNVEANWLEGCEVGFEESDLAAEANSICQCSFNAISANDGIAFEDFVDVDAELKNDPKKLSNNEGESAPIRAQLIDIVRTCIAEG